MKRAHFITAVSMFSVLVAFIVLFSMAIQVRAATVLFPGGGGTGWGYPGGLSSGSVLFGNGLNPVGTSTSLFWDNTNKRLGIGTTSPFLGFEVASNARQIGITNPGAGLNLKHWYEYVDNAGALDFGTSTDLGATSTPYALTITNAGTVGVNTSAPNSTFEISGANTGTLNQGLRISRTGGTIYTGIDAPGGSFNNAALNINGTRVLGFQSNGGAEVGSGYSTGVFAAPANGLIVQGLMGIGTTSPFAKVSIHANNGETNTTLFAIASSTSNATTTLFSIDNTGAATFTGQVNLPGNNTFFANGNISFNSHTVSNVATLTGSNSAGTNLSLGSNNSTGNLILEAGTQTEFARITSAGLFGIGTTTPTTVLVTVAASSTVATGAYTGLVSIIAGFENTTLKLFQEIDQWGHLITSGDTPTVSGGTSTVAGNDRNGTVTVAGTLLTSVTLTFSHPYLTAPDCVESDNSTAITADISSISTTQIVFGFSSGINSGTVWYQCAAHQ